MKDRLIKWFTALNTFWIRASRGRLGGKLGSQTILLLHTLGRRTGKKYITPIAYFSLDGFYFVIASNWGKDVNPAWYHNLQPNPRTVIEVNGKTIPVDAREVHGDEYDRLWKFATERHPPYLDYEKMADRHIPIVIFIPVAG